MSFSGSSFNLWTDSGLTSAYSGITSLIHKTDLSDNPQNITLYLGSPITGRILQATSSPGVDNVTLTPTDILPEWEASTAYVSGDKVQPVGGNGFLYQCTTSGTSGSEEPSWPVVTIGTTVADGTAVWSLVGAHHATTEIKLSLDSGTLGAATPGAALSIDNTISSGVGNAVPIYIRVTNAITTVENNTGHEELGININSCIETAIA